jgi:hypothetical protein
MLSTKNNYNKLPWKLLSIEAALVVFSVLLALGLNSWRQSQSHERLAERALRGIIEEVESNCTRIKNVQAYHQAVANGNRKPGGIQIGLLRNQSWDAAKTIGAAPHLDYEIVASIEKIYANQSDHRSISKSYVTALFTVILQEEQMEQGNAKTPAGEQAVIRELLRLQKTLLSEYQHFATLVEKHYNQSIETSNLCKES